MRASDALGVVTAIIILAGVAIAIRQGGNTANILKTAGESFSGVIKAATGNA